MGHKSRSYLSDPGTRDNLFASFAGRRQSALHINCQAKAEYSAVMQVRISTYNGVKWTHVATSNKVALHCGWSIPEIGCPTIYETKLPFRPQ